MAKLALSSHFPSSLHPSHQHLQTWASGPAQKVVKGEVRQSRGGGWTHMLLGVRPAPGPVLDQGCCTLKRAHMLGSHLSSVQIRTGVGRRDIACTEPPCLQVSLYSGLRNQKDQSRVSTGEPHAWTRALSVFWVQDSSPPSVG